MSPKKLATSVQRIHATAPWQVTALYKYGVPAAIAMYLVYALVSGQGSSLKNIEVALQAQKSAVADVAAATYRQEAYLRLVCVNTAKTTAERQTCLTVR